MSIEKVYLMEYVGGISGAALGYIHGNVAGARKGYKIGAQLGRNYVKNLPKQKEMAPLKRKNPYVTPTSGSRRVRMTPNAPVGRSRMLSIRRRSVSASAGAISRVATTGDVRVRRKGKPVRKAKKIVKVSRKLREKIKKVISTQKIQGRFQEIEYLKLTIDPTDDFKQSVRDITMFPTSGPNFSIIKILDAASILWNEKAFGATKTIADVRNFDPKKLKVKVVDSSVTYHFKNNTQRKYTLKVMNHYPVSRQVAGEPLPVWAAALNFQRGLDTAAGQVGPNQNNALVTELYTNPGQMPDFRKLFRTRTTVVELPAGGEYTHYVQGPKDRLIDMQTFWNGTLLQNTHKEAVHVSAIYYPDLVTTTLGGFGRYVDDTFAINQARGIVVESVSRYQLEMPEMVGTIASGPALNDPVPMNSRQYSYAYKTWPYVGELGSIVNVNTENPIQYTTVP